MLQTLFSFAWKSFSEKKAQEKLSNDTDVKKNEFSFFFCKIKKK